VFVANKVLDYAELGLLEKYLNYSLHPVQLQREEEVADVEICINSLP
jgi:hypothetical protein